MRILSKALAAILGLPQLVGQLPEAAGVPQFAGQHTASEPRRLKRQRVTEIGRRQERRERCRSYALKREAARG